MEARTLWTNGANRCLGINLYEGVEKPYFLMSSVWDGVKWQHRTVGKYATVEAAKIAAARYIKDNPLQQRWKAV